MAFQDIPYQNPLIELGGGRVQKLWTKWFGLLVDRIDNATERRAVVQLTDQNATIGVTPFPIGSLPGGIYRVSYYARITQAASTSSSLAVFFSWTDGAIACSQTFAAITGNTVSSTGSAILQIRADSNSAVAYGTTYSSVGATAMRYRLDLVVEAVVVE